MIMGILGGISLIDPLSFPEERLFVDAIRN